MIGDSLEAADPLDPADVAAADQLLRDRAHGMAETKLARLRSRMMAYARLFADKPMPGDAKIVLDDIQRFCRASTTPWHDDPRIHALLTGRFEVSARIRDHLTMTFDDLVEAYNKE